MRLSKDELEATAGVGVLSLSQCLPDPGVSAWALLTFEAGSGICCGVCTEHEL